MGLIDHEDSLVADEPEDFARSLIELYESEELWNRLSKNGIKKTQTLYSTEVARETPHALFSDQHLITVRGSRSAVTQRDVAMAARS